MLLMCGNNKAWPLPQKTQMCEKFEGSAKSMEPAVILKMVVKGPTKGYIVDWIVSNNNSKMQAHFRHPVSEVYPVNTKKKTKEKNQMKTKASFCHGSVSLCSRLTQRARTKLLQEFFINIAKKECWI